MCKICGMKSHEPPPKPTRKLRLTPDQVAGYRYWRSQGRKHWDILFYVAADVGDGFMQFCDTYSGAEYVDASGAVVTLSESDEVARV